MLPQRQHRYSGLLVVGLVALICLLVYYDIVRVPSWREESLPKGSHVHQSQDDNHDDYYYDSSDKGMTVK